MKIYSRFMDRWIDVGCFKKLWVETWDQYLYCISSCVLCWRLIRCGLRLMVRWGGGGDSWCRFLPPRERGAKDDASTVNRTQGLKIFSLALSQLSYRGLLSGVVSSTYLFIILWSQAISAFSILNMFSSTYLFINLWSQALSAFSIVHCLHKQPCEHGAVGSVGSGKNRKDTCFGSK